MTSRLYGVALSDFDGKMLYREGSAGCMIWGAKLFHIGLGKTGIFGSQNGLLLCHGMV